VSHLKGQKVKKNNTKKTKEGTKGPFSKGTKKKTVSSVELFTQSF